MLVEQIDSEIHNSKREKRIKELKIQSLRKSKNELTNTLSKDKIDIETLESIYRILNKTILSNNATGRGKYFS